MSTDKASLILENSPFKSTQNLSKKERKAREIPPNAHNEMLWERTMNPETGRLETEKLLAVQNEHQQVKQYRRLSKAYTHEHLIWTERGPADLGGRTRALLFDPSDIGNANSNLKDLKISPTVSNGNIKIMSQKDFGPTVIKIWSISGRMVFQFDLN